MKIVVLDESVTVKDGLNFDGLRKFGDLTVYAHTRPEEVRSRIGDAAVVLINKAPITREIMAEAHLRAGHRLQRGRLRRRTGVRHFRVQRSRLQHLRRVSVHHCPAFGTMP